MMPPSSRGEHRLARTLAIVALALVATFKIGDELIRLTVATGPSAAIDLGLRYQEVKLWFSGAPVYGAVQWIAYPPQTYTVLWPFLGWLDFAEARWLWAVTSIGSLAWLVALLIRGSGATEPRDRAVLLMMTLAMNAVGVTIGNGQLIVHLLPALLASIVLMAHPRRSLARDATAAGLLVVAMTKPTIVAPFVWVALAVGGWRPVALASVGYVVCSWVAALFQPASLVTLISRWVAQSRAEIGGGYGDVQSALVNLGAVGLAASAPIAIIVAHGVWSWRHRRADLWVQLGVAALVARFWAYHRVYDDVLILVPMVALFRLAQRAPTQPERTRAGLLLVVAIVAMVAPARLEHASPPLNWIFVGGHVVVWLAMLAVLASAARALPGPPTAQGEGPSPTDSDGLVASAPSCVSRGAPGS